MKPFAVALSGVGKGMRGRDGGGDLSNVQYKPTCHNESLLYKEYILIKRLMKKNTQKMLMDFGLAEEVKVNISTEGGFSYWSGSKICVVYKQSVTEKIKNNRKMLLLGRTEKEFTILMKTQSFLML
jgi:hypothetical protein